MLSHLQFKARTLTRPPYNPMLVNATFMQHAEDSKIPANFLSKIVLAVADAECLLSQPAESTTVMDDKLSQKLKQSQ